MSTQSQLPSFSKKESRLPADAGVSLAPLKVFVVVELVFIDTREFPGSHGLELDFLLRLHEK
jgi:hypothetical protein